MEFVKAEYNNLDATDPLGMDKVFCINCGSNSASTMMLQDPRILQCIRQWTAPLSVQPQDHVCSKCWNEAYNTCNSRHCALCNNELPPRTRSHQVLGLRTDTQHHINIKNTILQRLQPLQVDASCYVCHPCWQRADRAAKRAAGASVTTKQIRCANCTVNVTRLKRHILSNGDILANVQQLVTPRVVTANDYICDACHKAFTQEEVKSELHNSISPIGHQSVCFQCGRSVANVRAHTIEADVYCHKCYQRTQSSSNVTLDDLARELTPQQPDIITLPNYTRAPESHARCIFPKCNSTSQQMVPFCIRVRLIVDHKHYIPPNCRICKFHLESQTWSGLFEVENLLHTFTASHIEDFCELLKANVDFNSDETMEEHLRVWHTPTLAAPVRGRALRRKYRRSTSCFVRRRRDKINIEHTD